VPVSGATVGAALGDLTSKHPALRPHLYTDVGELRAFVNIFLNDEDVRHLQGAHTPVKEGDRLMIVPSIAGGDNDRRQTIDDREARLSSVVSRLSS
jgi:adenylyltransferase/sulfurtransferase